MLGLLSTVHNRIIFCILECNSQEWLILSKKLTIYLKMFANKAGFLLVNHISLLKSLYPYAAAHNWRKRNADPA
jgi:hypothetical protein